MLHLNTIDDRMADLLKQFCEADYLNKFALAGGTSLALQIGHRKSVDIDMFAFEDVDMQEIAIFLQNEYLEIAVRRITKVFIFCQIKAIKCDFVNYSKIKTIRPIRKIDGINLFSIEDIAAMKLHAVCGRGSKRDFYDIYSLLNIFSLKELLAFYEEKFHSDNSWMALKSLQYFDDADEEEAPVCIHEFPTWQNIKQSIIKQVNGFKFN